MSEQEIEVVEGITEGASFPDLQPGNHTVKIHGEFRKNRDGFYCLAVGVLDSRGGTGCLNVVTEDARKQLEPLLGKPKAVRVRCPVAGQLYLLKPKAEKK